MRLSSVLSSLLKGKFLVIALVGIAITAGTAAMAASTPAGRNVVESVVSLTSATSTPGKPSLATGPKSGDTATPGTNKSAADCAGLPEAQTLAASFSLSTNSTSACSSGDLCAPSRHLQGNHTRRICYFLQSGFWLW